jgi:hypothetical protein
MYRSSLALILLTCCTFASAQACSVAGKTLGTNGKPIHSAYVRLTNLETGQRSFGAADGNADFQVGDSGGGQYRLDLLGPSIRVTGSLIYTRSVIGTADFSCSSGSERMDVRALVD